MRTGIDTFWSFKKFETRLNSYNKMLKLHGYNKIKLGLNLPKFTLSKLNHMQTKYSAKYWKLQIQIEMIWSMIDWLKKN